MCQRNGLSWENISFGSGTEEEAMSVILAKVLSLGVSGVNGYPVHVEVFATGGIPMMEIIGLPDASVRESKTASARRSPTADEALKATIPIGSLLILRRLTSGKKVRLSIFRLRWAL